MPVNKSPGSVLSKIHNQLVKAHEAHKDDETEYSNFGDLPPGIEDGVAQLVTCKFDVFKEGTQMAGYPYFFADATVIEPETLDGKKVAGRRTKIGPEPLCDTPKRTRATVADHLAWIYNELRKLGVDTKNLSVDDLESTAEALQSSGIFIQFRTWAGQPSEKYPKPMTNHTWQGVLDDYTPTVADEVQDDSPPPPAQPVKAKVATPPVSSRTAQKSTPTPAKVAAPPAKSKKAPPPPVQETEPAPSFSEFSVEDLVAGCNNDDEGAKNELTRLAIEAGHTQEEVDGADSWEAVGAMLSAASEEDSDELSDEGGFTPQVGEVWKYRPVNLKTKKKEAKSVECEVLSVNEEQRTVSLRNLDNKKVTYPTVSWDDLEGDEE